MTSIKVKFRPSTISCKQGTIYYQLIHERKTKNINTNYHIFHEEWDERRSMVRTNHTNENDGKSFLLSVRERIKWDVESITKIVRRMENEGMSYSVVDIVEEFERHRYEYSLFNFMERIIIKLKQNGKIRTAETYKTTLNSFRKFRNDEDVMLGLINADIMKAYEAWLSQRGLIPNTISFYTRILRAVYNRAVEEEIIVNRNPFRYVYTGIEKTVKRALPLSTISKIKNLDLSFNPSLDYARDMFMLSFMLRGMSFIDMAFLRKSDRANGYITYRRRKTGQKLIIAWTKEMQKILDKYPENTSVYLLPIIKNPGANERITYNNVGSYINYNLKTIATMIGVSIPLTLYVARHSWASAAKEKGIPVSIISEGMGHDNESTTQIYLASLDTSVVDKANALIINSL